MAAAANFKHSLVDARVDLSWAELLDVTMLGVLADDDFAFTQFHESDSDEETSPHATESSIDTTKPPRITDNDSRGNAVAMAIPISISSHQPSQETITFAEKTYYMINTCAPHVVCWNATGTGFFIPDTRAFTHTVLPEYFKHYNLKRFVRELRLHGFRQTLKCHKARAIACLEFCHPHFLRGNVARLAQIQRRTPNASPRLTSLEGAMKDCGYGSMGGLKSEVCKLKGEVQHAQHLFEQLITTLKQQNVAESISKDSVMPMHQYSHHPLETFGSPRSEQGINPAIYAPQTFGMNTTVPDQVGSHAAIKHDVLEGDADSNDFLADFLFPEFE